jgi:hypothetical protein
MRMFDDDDTVEIAFELPAAVGAERAAVVGEFNAWSRDADQMLRHDDGSFSLSLRLQRGRTYRYRYLLDDDRWENDWNADRYEPNSHGGDDSLIDLTDDSSRRQRARPRTAHEIDDEKSVRSIVLDADDGGTVVIEQQNVGPANQVGGGEFKNLEGRSVDAAARDQDQLEHDAPIDRP